MKAIYHIPKTGGNSTYQMCIPTGVHHLGHCDFQGEHAFRKLLREHPTDKYTEIAAVVRDPIQRWLSAWRYFRQGGVGTSEDTFFIQKLRTMDINEFAMSGYWQGVLHFLPQYVLITDRKGLLIPTHVFEFNDWEGLAEWMGYEGSIPHKNKSEESIDALDLHSIVRLNTYYRNDYLLIEKEVI